MKKLICITLVLLVTLGALTSCNFTQNSSGALAGAAEATPKVEEMMTALAESRTEDAKVLMHPEVAEKSDAAIAQLVAFLSGRNASSMEQKNINVSSSTGTSGKTRQENVVYRVTLTEGEVIYLNVTYLSDNGGTGFLSFQIVLGVA